MDKQHKRDFAQLMTGVAEVYGKDISEAGLRIWWSALDRFDFDQVRRAVDAHCNDAERGQWMPRPADVVRQIEGTPTEQAQAAWAKVEHALRGIGGGPSWVFDDPGIHRALQQIGGVAALSNCPSEKDLTFLREQFCKRYASPNNHGPYPAKLTGWHSDGEAVFIGDQSRCQQVLEGGGNDRPAISGASEAADVMLEDMRVGGGA